MIFLDSLRNYAVLKIAVEETRTFSTKSRTPFMITLEIFRPEESLLLYYSFQFE